MKHSITRTAAVIATLAVGITTSGCAAAGGAPAPARDDTIIIGTGAVPQSLDPILASDVQTDFTTGAMYDKLVDYDEDGALVPLLATEWAYDDAATTVTLALRDDVTFHSGNPLTADDVVYTLERDARLGLGVASFISTFASAEAVDDTHVTITLNAPNTTFVGALSKVYIVDSVLVAENEGTDDAQSWLASNDAGSGVYALDDYTANQSAELSRFDDSWRFDEARPENLVYRYITESSTLRDELASGGVDVVTGITPADQKTFADKDGFDMVSLPSMLQLYFMMNTQSGVTADPAVREAIQLAYDYEGHISSILSGNGEVATGIASPAVSCRVDAGASEQDVDAAKKIISDAGLEGTTLTLAYQSVIPEHQKAATLLQSNLKDIGLNLELKTVTYPEYMALISDPATVPDIGVLWDFPYYPEIGPMLYRVYDSSFIGQSNYGLYSNPEVDSLLEAGIASTDPDEACASFTAAQEQIIADRVSVNVSNPTTTTVTSSAVDGLAYRPTYQLFDPTLLTLAE